MSEIFIYSYLGSIHLLITGYISYYFFFNKPVEELKNIFELGLIGTILLSFIALFLNFFTKLSQSINDIIFLIPIILFCFIYEKKFLKKIFLISIFIATAFTITIAFDNIYRPDAGLYHLPYTSIINENKIIIGAGNLHFRFGHTSIMQYLSAVYNNHLFGDKGILIPLGLIFCNFVGYLIYEIFNNTKNQRQIIIYFIFFSFSIFMVNRYSNFGNDAPAHFYFFYLICESVKKNDLFIKIKKSSIISTFVFFNKITLLFCFFIPIYLILKNLNLKHVFNKINIFCIIFIFLFFLKNFLISGCFIFPANISCVEKAFWYDKGSNRNSNAINTKVENEAWAKGWPSQKERKKSYKEYISDSAWINTWKKDHGKIIIKKILPFLIFISLIILLILFHEIKNKKQNYSKNKLNSDEIIFFFISLLGIIFWFTNFPVFRYGYSYLISSFALLHLIALGHFQIFENILKYKKFLSVIVILLICGVISKNIFRIVKNYTSNHPWPAIYSENNDLKKIDNIPIIKNKKIIFYKSKNGTCHYNKSPCTHYFNGNDFTIDEINLKILFGYKIFYFNKIN